MITLELMLLVFLGVSFAFGVSVLACYVLSSDWRIKPMLDLYRRLYEKVLALKTRKRSMNG